MFKRIVLIILSLAISQTSLLFSQCTDGTQNACTCLTADVLCTVDQLDNYFFSMADYSHPNDGPSPICPGTNGSVTNNPTWFAFTAWCTDLTLNCSFSNCVNAGAWEGVQVAIYTDCTWTNTVACNANTGDCNLADKVLSMTGLTIGAVYYFMVDGCAGATCDVTIDVVGVCGQEEILPWTLPLMGNLNPCAGVNENYTVETLSGAANYHWYVDNVLISTTTGPSFDYTWPAGGSYQICVDASNDPCVPESDPPPPLCTTINVYESDAGDLTITPTTLCPGEIASISVSNFNAGPDNAQAILITDASGVILEVITGSTGTYTSAVCGTFTVYSYNYIPAIGTAPTIGLDVNTIDCVAECCDLEMLTISFEDTQAPTFPNPPADITVDCNDLVPTIADLAWDDNCDGMGMVAGQQNGSADNCNGGTIGRSWEYVDGCGNTGSHTQTITVNPTPPPTFDMLPANETVSCDNIPTSGVDLTYTNNALGACLISGSVSPTQTGSADICGGSITYNWDLTDVCGNNISHSQTINVTPADPPAFINPPANVTVDCDNIPTSAPDLTYTNNGTGLCLISGSVSAIETGTADICGGEIRYEWTVTDPCGITITHVQTVTVTPAPAAQFVNPPASMTVDCNSIPTGGPDLTYTNNGTGACLISGTVSAVESGSADICGGTITYTWDFTDACGNSTTHSQDITVTPAAAPTFSNLPADMTVACDNIPTSASDLSYTNNGIGACLIAGTVSPVQSGTGDICGGTISYTWNFTDACGNVLNHVQNFTIDPASPPAFINPPANQNVSCDALPTSAPNLSYTNNENGACLISGSVPAVQSGNADVCGGQIDFTWEFTDQCGNAIQHVQSYVVDPAPEAVFTDPLPGDITVDCNAVPTTAPPLNYSNGLSGACEIAGIQNAVQLGSYTACGGTFQFLWEFTDPCGRVLSHTQNVTVNPAPAAMFINPPGPITVACSAVPPTPPSISYTNGQSGLCTISGSVIAIQSGSFDACGGSLTYNWVFTDPCNRTISHNQVVTVLPASDPIFVNPPPDITIDCGVPFPDPYGITYSNSETGNCEIMGEVFSNVTINGLIGIYEWFWTNPCNNMSIFHTQTITQTAEPLLVVNPTDVIICEGQSFDLTSISVIDQNNTNPIITYHSGTPANIGNQLPSPNVSPTITTTYYILGANNSGCSNETTFEVIVEPPPFAGNNGMGAVCFSQSQSVNLFDYLIGNTDQSGYWVDSYAYGVDVSNPFNVDLSQLSPGNYTFDYFLPSGGVCPDDMASITLNVLEELFIEVSSITCSAGNSTYEVIIETYGLEINALAGTTTDLGNNQILVADIPIGTLLLISYTNPGFPECQEFFPVASPNCDCPNVDPPVSNGDVEICVGEPNPELSVSVGTDETANWYDAPSGGALLIAGSLTYTSTETAPGVYTYFVQTENVNDGCLSSLLTQVVFEINENPAANNAALSTCDIDGTGLATFDLTLANAMINADPTNTFAFYPTLTDATNETNPLPNTFTTTTAPTQTIFVVVTSVAGCSSITELALTVDPLPALTLSIQNETCAGAMDGQVTINSSTATSYSMDGVAWQTTNTFGPLAVGSYTAYVQDSLGCINSLPFSIQDGLLLSVENFTPVCNDNGTPSDATDDFYTINFTINNNQGNLGSFIVSNGTINLGTFNYGANNSITLPAEGQSLTLTFTDDIFSCSITQAVGPLTSCSTDCIISIELLTFECSDNGTDADPSDDFYTVNINAAAINGAANGTYNVLINSVLNFNYPYGTLSSFTIPADGSTPIITVVDNSDAQCQASQSIGPLAPCSDACVIQITSVDSNCDDNGTLTNPADDFYNITVNASAINPGTSNSFEVFANGVSQGIFDYSSAAQFTLPADGSLITISVQDSDDANCTSEQSIGTLEPCDEDCTINATVSNIVCDDNGTGNDDTDDTFTFDIFVSGQNTGTGWQSTDASISGSYGVTESFGPYSINGGSLNFDLQDITTPTCLTSILVNAPSACSDPCTISATVTNVICDDNDTPNDDTDDTFTFDVLVSGQNTGATWQSTDGSISGSYDVNESFGPFAINGGDLNFDLEDSNTSVCLTAISVNAPSTCSDACSINIDLLTSDCDDNGTLTNPADDFYSISLNASAINPGVNNSFEVFANGVSQGTFDYSVTAMFTLPADGSTVTISIEDADDAACFAEQPIGILEPCNEDCTINAAVSNVVCDDSNTPNDDTDDTFTFDIFVSGQNTGTTWQSTDASISGSYGVTESFGPFPISGGSLNYDLQDNITAACLTSITIDAPAPCSDACMISIDLLTSECDDNGTLTNPADDFYNRSLNASAINPGMSNSFEVFANGISLGVFDYSTTANFTLPADGTSVTIRIEDINFSVCFEEQSIGTLEPCDEDCSINATVSNIVCDDNGTPNDDSDDTFTFDVFVSGQNTGTTWQSTDGTLSGSYGATLSFGPYLITAGSLNFDLQDNTTASCITSIVVNAPATCSDACIISIDLLTSECDDNGTLTDPADDFYNVSLNASAINPGASNSFEVFANGISQGTYDYATTANFTLPADGTAVTISIEDANFAICFAEQSIGTLEPCNEDCTINATVSNIVCDDNGTGNDDTDDTYTFDVFVSGQNIGTGWQSTDGSISGSYGLTETFGPYLISGGSLNLSLQDLITPSCIAFISATAPASCSSCGQTVEAGGSSTITCDNPFGYLNGSASDNGNFEWTGPNGFTSNNLIDSTNISGWFILTGSFPLNCSAVDSVFIDISNDLPIADAGPDFMITCTDTSATLDGSASIGSNLNYQWFDQNMNLVGSQVAHSTNLSGNYTLSITDAVTGCTNTDQAIVTINQTQPQAIIYADPDNILNCVISSITLSSDPQANVIYNWNNVTAENFVIDQAGTVDLLAIDTINGCQNTNTIEITDLEDYPLVSLEAPDPLSCYNPEITILGTNSQTGNGIIYQWFDPFSNLIIGEFGNTLTVDASGFYILQLIDTLNGCENSDTVFVDELFTTPLAQNVEDTTLYCGVQQTTLALDLLSAPDDLQISWTTNDGTILNGANSLTPQVLGSGVYAVEVLNLISGCIIEDSLVVALNDDYPTLIQANLEPENCLGDNNGSINITQVQGGSFPLEYNLNGEVTNENTFENLSPGFYNLQITDGNGCRLDSSFIIEPGIDLEVDLPLQLDLVQDQFGTIEAIINVDEADLIDIQWNPPGLLSCDNCLITSIQAVDNQIFQLIIVHENGCVAIAELRVIVRDKASIYIPNVFSPNNDGNNDIFTIFANDEVEEIEELAIFDRWGEQVFKSEDFPPNNLSFGWDGRLKGEPMNPAVFVYMVTVKLKNGNTEIYSGDLTLIK